MRKGGGHAKGAGFERQMAKEIIKAFRKAHPKEKFVQNDCWRSVMSGGHDMSSGDLRMSPRLQELFPYSIECKFRKKIRWQNFLLSKSSEEQRWVKQAQDGAKKLKGSIPILVMKANRQPGVWALAKLDTTLFHLPKIKMADGQEWFLISWKKFLKEAVECSKLGA